MPYTLADELRNLLTWRSMTDREIRKRISSWTAEDRAELLRTSEFRRLGIGGDAIWSLAVNIETCPKCDGAGEILTPEGWKAIRLAAGMTQDQLADYLDAWQGYISDIERGMRNAGLRVTRLVLKLQRELMEDEDR